MPLCRFRSDARSAPRLGFIVGNQVIDLAAAGGPDSMREALRLDAATLRQRLDAAAAKQSGRTALDAVSLAAPIDAQEVWAAGVTYLRSRDARMEESTQKDIYDLVYDAPRPELFFKATPNRVAGPGEQIAIRGDSTWDVPEPEVALVINRGGEIVGYTIGNDVSSRSIEGENSLYLPQAKVYSKCASLGPTVTLAWEIASLDALPIQLKILRGGETLFEGETSTAQIHRPFSELVAYLRACNEFPDGVVLMTGTGIVPPNEFTLEEGDVVEIVIAGFGTLRNPVIRLAL
ncbi:MAG TPA: fumarylacetoacetate hydrolase family protein [Thermomicrobiales bacterium]|nr:fumarylacetoacetate hydrolase family protein [Thermomicrobiales bacterium]